MAINFISWPHHLTLGLQNLGTGKEIFNPPVQPSTTVSQPFDVTWQLKSDYFLLPEISFRTYFYDHPPLDRSRVGPLCPVGNGCNSLGLMVLE